MAKVRKHVIIKGLVQGVWFRATTQDQALAHQVTGWVKNTSDGNVEAVFEGEVEDVEKVIQWCHQGPSGARVKDVEVETEEYKGEYSTFSIKSSYW
ncbi:MAG: acylphosphatase [Candidatus Aminicenantes bacterium]|nr:MAG: acylphosphatase [Candidatus Aminicenantes bacterium]